MNSIAFHVLLALGASIALGVLARHPALEALAIGAAAAVAAVLWLAHTDPGRLARLAEHPLLGAPIAWAGRIGGLDAPAASFGPSAPDAERVAAAEGEWPADWLVRRLRAELADRFFGRAAHIERLATLLERQRGIEPANRPFLTLLYGGRESVGRRSFALAAARVLDAPSRVVRAGEDHAVDTVARVAAQSGRRVLIVDGFEDADPLVRGAIARITCGLERVPPRLVLVVLTTRLAEAADDRTTFLEPWVPDLVERFELPGEEDVMRAVERAFIERARALECEVTRVAAETIVREGRKVLERGDFSRLEARIDFALRRAARDRSPEAAVRPLRS